jgi:hypothetical protein
MKLDLVLSTATCIELDRIKLRLSILVVITKINKSVHKKKRLKSSLNIIYTRSKQPHIRAKYEN